jgi:hypothetical protein
MKSLIYSVAGFWAICMLALVFFCVNDVKAWDEDGGGNFFSSVGDLVADCVTDEEIAQAYCHAFIAGVTDTVALFETCDDNGVTLAEMKYTITLNLVQAIAKDISVKGHAASSAVVYFYVKNYCETNTKAERKEISL